MASILLIEDEEMVREALAETLEQGGYEVRVASNGKQGIQLYQNNPADLVITDIFMPEQDGIETILQLTREYPEIKILAISGGGDWMRSLEFLEHAALFGAIKTLTKPVDPKKLLDTIRDILNIS